MGTSSRAARDFIDDALTDRRVVVPALLAIALAVRCLHLDRSLWLDEGLSLHQAAALGRVDAQRPLYFLILRLWMLTGRGEIWLRLPSVLFGVAGVGVLYAVGRRLAGSRAALLAALFMALSPALAWHAQELRMYSLAPLLMLLSTLTLLRWFERGARSRLVVHAACAYLTLLCHPVNIFGVASMAAFAFACLREQLDTPARQRALRDLGATYGALALLWLPFAFLSARHPEATAWLTRPGPGVLLTLHVWSFVRNFKGPWVRAILEPAVLTCLVAALLRAWRSSDRASTAVIPIAAWFYGPVAAIFSRSVLSRPCWILRFFTGYAPALFLTVAIGAVALHGRMRWLSYVVVGSILSLQVAALRVLAAPGEEWRAAARYVAAHASPGDAVIVWGAGSPGVNVWSYYFERPSAAVDSLDELRRALPRASTTRVWIAARLLDEYEERTRQVAAALGPRATVVGHTFPGVAVIEGSFPSLPPTPSVNADESSGSVSSR
jgi:uncharacterized membrane protein